MLQDGLNKVVEGYTSFEEIYKLIEIDEAETSLGSDAVKAADLQEANEIQKEEQ